jgi:hypothetical protein
MATTASTGLASPPHIRTINQSPISFDVPLAAYKSAALAASTARSA